MAKLKNILNESNVQLGKVYSNPYATPFVKENEENEESEVALSEEQRKAFFEAVKQYRKYGESVYRNAGLEEVYETIRNMVEVANKVTLSETGDWFDNVTVGRHMKRMGESFKVFEKTLKEVGTLQQRLESSYDEIGEVLSKYYEINEMEDEIEEGNEFGAARAKAIANGDDSFEVDGKTYPVKDVDNDDKENAKDFANESTSMKLTDILNKSNPINEVNTRLNKKVKSFMDAYLKGIPTSSPEYYHTVMVVLKGALTDANFHSEAKKLDSMFPKAKKSKYYDNSNMNDVMEDKGVDIAGWAKWDGHDILDAFSYFTNMTIGGGFGNKLETLKESVNEAGEFAGWIAGYNGKKIEIKKGEAKDLYNAKLLAIKKLKVPKSKVGLMFIKPAVDESVNEGVEPQIKKIAHFTGTRPEAVEDFVSKHSLNITKLLKYVQKGGLPQRMELVSALAGRDGNATQKKVIKMFSESAMNEAKYDIGMARKGNGITIYNKAEEENGDYKNVAHIDNKGKVKYLDKKIPSNIKKQIEAEAKKMMEITTEAKGNTMKLKDLLNESFGMGELPSSKLLKMKVSAKDMLESVGESTLNENKYSIIDPRGNTAGTGTKDQANKRVKQLGGSKKGYFVVPAKLALKARRAMEKYKFDFKNAKLQDTLSDFYWESVDESVNEAQLQRSEVSKLQKGLERVLGTSVNIDTNSAGAHEFYINNAKFMIGIGDGIDRGTKFSFDIYDDGAIKTLVSGKSDNINDLIKQIISVAKKHKKSLLQTESLNEGASTEEKRIVMLAVRKIAKLRNVPINQSVVDVQRAADELERDIQKGKVKK